MSAGALGSTDDEPAEDLEPYLTSDVPPIGAAHKQRPEDFRVDELPLYPASGEGTHHFLRIEKQGIDTPAAVRAIARALDLRPDDVGAAGLKDARAVTTQWLSVEHVDEERIARLELRDVRVLEVTRHRNKLRRGHLAGNRFRIRLREVDPGREVDAGRVLDELALRGMPSWFGPQRFGHRGDSADIGAALLRGDDEEAVRLLCGRPGPRDSGPVLAARTLFEEGRVAEAAARFPRGYHDARRACAALCKRGGDYSAAARSIGRRARTLLVSAWQSRLFNRVLAARLRSGDLGLGDVVAGDIACKHDTGGAFLVGPEDAADAAARAQSFAISATGPLAGLRTLRPEGRVREIEDAALGGVLDDDELLACVARFDCQGGRRPLRQRPENCGLEVGGDEHGSYLELRFTLPSGTYATSLLREVCKGGLR